MGTRTVKHAPATAPAGGPPGARLRRAREALGLSQSAAAARAGLRQGDLSAVETGKVGLSLDRAYRLATAIGADPADVDARLAPAGGPPSVTLVLRRDGVLVGDTPGDDARVRDLLPTSDVRVSNLPGLIRHAADQGVMVLIRTDLPAID